MLMLCLLHSQYQIKLYKRNRDIPYTIPYTSSESKLRLVCCCMIEYQFLVKHQIHWSEIPLTTSSFFFLFH